jgi:hypothetical protein
MKYAIYEDPLTHKFALLALSSQFVDGDTPPIVDVDRWFSSREEVVAALPDLLNREEPDSVESTQRNGPLVIKQPARRTQ